MKNFFTYYLLLLLCPSLIFGQKSVIQAAEKALERSSVEKAVTEGTAPPCFARFYTFTGSASNITNCSNSFCFTLWESISGNFTSKAPYATAYFSYCTN